MDMCIPDVCILWQAVCYWQRRTKTIIKDQQLLTADLGYSSWAVWFPSLPPHPSPARAAGLPFLSEQAMLQSPCLFHILCSFLILEILLLPEVPSAFWKNALWSCSARLRNILQSIVPFLQEGASISPSSCFSLWAVAGDFQNSWCGASTWTKLGRCSHVSTGLCILAWMEARHSFTGGIPSSLLTGYHQRCRKPIFWESEVRHPLHKAKIKTSAGPVLSRA